MSCLSTSVLCKECSVLSRVELLLGVVGDATNVVEDALSAMEVWGFDGVTGKGSSCSDIALKVPESRGESGGEVREIER